MIRKEPELALSIITWKITRRAKGIGGDHRPASSRGLFSPEKRIKKKTGKKTRETVERRDWLRGVDGLIGCVILFVYFFISFYLFIYIFFS